MTSEDRWSFYNSAGTLDLDDVIVVTNSLKYIVDPAPIVQVLYYVKCMDWALPLLKAAIKQTISNAAVCESITAPLAGVRRGRLNVNPLVDYANEHRPLGGFYLHTSAKERDEAADAGLNPILYHQGYGSVYIWGIDLWQHGKLVSPYIAPRPDGTRNPYAYVCLQALRAYGVRV